MSNIGDLGRPIGGGGAAGYTGTQQPDVTEFSEAGEHGQGAGVSGGVSLFGVSRNLEDEY